MARELNRGEIWTYRFSPPDKQHPVVILSRQQVIGLLQTVMVAPVTSSVRGLLSEVPVGVEEGLKHASAVNLDHVQTVEHSRLVRFLCHLGPARMRRCLPGTRGSRGLRRVATDPGSG